MKYHQPSDRYSECRFDLKNIPTDASKSFIFYLIFIVYLIRWSRQMPRYVSSWTSVDRMSDLQKLLLYNAQWTDLRSLFTFCCVMRCQFATLGREHILLQLDKWFLHFPLNFYWVMIQMKSSWYSYHQANRSRRDKRLNTPQKIWMWGRHSSKEYSSVHIIYKGQTRKIQTVNPVR